MKSYFGRFIPLLFFIAIALTISNALIFFYSLHDLINDQSLLSHTHEVLTEIEGTFSSLREAESAERGYIITDDDQYINFFSTTINLITYHLQRVNNLTKDNPIQQKNLQVLKQKITERLSYLKGGITVRKNGSFDQAQQIVTNGKGLEKMREIRDITISMEKEENRLFKIRSQRSNVNVDEMYTTISLSMLLNLLLIFISFFLIKREFDQRSTVERRKNDFISIASHELKTPITSMSVFADLLQKKVILYKDRQASHYLARIREQITRQTALINDLLDISKMQAGKIELHKEVFDLNKLVRETVEVMQTSTKMHKIIIKGKVRSKIFGDRQRLGQVLINFLSNAIKYSPQAKKIIIFTSEEKKLITVSVQDFGIGIAKIHHKKIFSRFYRAMEEGKGSYPGLGIGLYITFEIIRRHGGRVWVDSVEGKGSIFYFTLPISS